MKTMHQFIFAASVALSVFTPALAVETNEEEAMIVTSKPHRLPRLMTIQTSEVLESYAIGFAGSGNMHSIMKGSRDAMNGAIYLGLGDVAELGYDMEEIHLEGGISDKRMKGHIKIQPVSEGRYVPAVAVTYGANIADEIEVGHDTPFGLSRQSWMVGASKSFQIGNYKVSLHPAATFQYDRITKVADSSLGENSPSGKNVGYQLGATWQTTDNTMFLLESRSVSILDTSITTESAEPSYHTGFENNLGVRFYLRNWLFIDAGILSMYDVEKSTWDTGIHANITGLIPLKSVGERIFGSAK